MPQSMTPIHRASLAFPAVGEPYNSQLLLRFQGINLGAGPDSQFQPVSQLSLGNEVYSVRIMVGCIGTVVLYRGPEFLVWNWIKNEGCRWISPVHLLGEKSSAYVFNNGILTTDHCGNVHVWDIPDLRTLPTVPCVSQFPIVQNKPKACIPFAGVAGYTPRVLLRGTGFQGDNPYFCFFYDNQPTPSGVLLSLFSVKRLGHRNDPFFPEVLLVPGGTSDKLYGDTDVEFGRAISSLTLCDGNLLFCADTVERRLTLTVLPVPSGAEFGPIPLSSRHLTPPNSIYAAFHNSKLGFCPMSGRVVYFKPNGSVCLLDFLRPPCEPDS
ncbi:hypothetical protein NMY22_g16444 [Coprinellus aureogranulatus]|nr:hypothetical protein NMY22_g16444 [Coprinellus aureogranulatus]